MKRYREDYSEIRSERKYQRIGGLPYDVGSWTDIKKTDLNRRRSVKRRNDRLLYDEGVDSNWKMKCWKDCSEKGAMEILAKL